MQIRTFSCALLLLFAQPRMEASPYELSFPEFKSAPTPADYVGTWVGRTADGEFKIVLKEQKNFKFPTGQTFDVMVGRHSYITNKGTVKTESLSKPLGSQALLGIPELSSPGVLQMLFSDNVNHKNVDVTLTFVAGSLKKLRWLVVGERETITVNARPDQLSIQGVSVPTNLILEKVD